MSVNLITMAGFYPPARNAIRYADLLAQAFNGQLLLLHAKRVAMFDPYQTLGESSRQAELAGQQDTAAILYQQAKELQTPATVEVVTDFLPVVALDMAARLHPALFVVGAYHRPHKGESNDTALACAELLRTTCHPVLTVPHTALDTEPPRRFLIAADRELFQLSPEAEPLRQLLQAPGVEVAVAHISEEVEDDADCAAALRAVLGSGLLANLPPPALHGMVHNHPADGILEVATDMAADVIIVLARQRSYLSEFFHDSITARLLDRSPIPVLVLPTLPA